MYDKGSQPPVFVPDVTTKHGCPPNAVPLRPSDATQHPASSPPSVKHPVPSGSGVRGETVTGGGGGLGGGRGCGDGGGGRGVGGGGGGGGGGEEDAGEGAGDALAGGGLAFGAGEAVVVTVVSRFISA